MQTIVVVRDVDYLLVVERFLADFFLYRQRVFVESLGNTLHTPYNLVNITLTWS